MDRENSADFLSFVGEHISISCAQRMQDLWALWESGFKHKRSYYVEFGALNGKDFSNTYILEKLGWRGVIAEPHPDYADIVRKNRKCDFSTKCVFDKTGETVVFNAVVGRPALSSIGTHINQDDKKALRQNFVAHHVETITLEDLLLEVKAPTKIDFLSIDTEGSELAILRAFNFKKFDIQLICVEHNDTMRDELYTLLSANDYTRKWPELSGHDDWYVRKDAYPDWSSKNMATTSKKLKKLPVFDAHLKQREELFKSLQT